MKRSDEPSFYEREPFDLSRVPMEKVIFGLTDSQATTVQESAQLASEIVDDVLAYARAKVRAVEARRVK